MKRKLFFVSPIGNSWKLTFSGKTLYSNQSKDPVIAIGRQTAHANMPSELLIQNADGSISARETYGNDPFPPRG